MIELSGLRRYITHEGRARLEADIKFSDMGVDAPADTVYFEIDQNYGGMLVDDTYDPFILTAMYQAMYYHSDLKICGNVSKRLYKNLMSYGQKILCDFSTDLAPVKIFVEGYAPAKNFGSLIGAGISCGVDSLSTVYDRFIREDDPDYKINALFFFNCGANGEFIDPSTKITAQNHFRKSSAFAAELNLPICFVDSNLHRFKRKDFGETLLFLSIYSCVLALQNAIRRYHMAGSYTYDQIKSCRADDEHCDLWHFCESYFLPLISTERTEFILDGCQYRRVEKVQRLADWRPARKFLDVCNQHAEDFSNCGVCQKCLRTLLTLEIIGKLDDFAEIFDLEQYRRESFNFKTACVMNADKDVFSREIVDLAAEKNFPMPERCDCYILGGNVMVVANK